jgi:hypothetical protein
VACVSIVSSAVIEHLYSKCLYYASRSIILIKWWPHESGLVFVSPSNHSYYFKDSERVASHHPFSLKRAQQFCLHRLKAEELSRLALDAVSPEKPEGPH